LHDRYRSRSGSAFGTTWLGEHRPQPFCRTDFRANGQLAGCDGAIIAAVVEHADSNIFATFP